MTKYLCVLALLAVLFGCAVAQQCTVGINAVRQATWIDSETQPRSLWTVTLSAPVDVSNVFVTINGPIQQIWEMVQVDNTNVYRLPDWRLQIGGIMAGQSHVFGFIINNNNAASPVSLLNVVCPGVSPSPSTIVNTPQPSGSPSPTFSPSRSPSPSTIVNTPQPSGSPSPTFSPSRSPSPSTIVNTPQPSGSPSSSPSPTKASSCSADVTQTARSSSMGGSWTSGGFMFQIYDITVRNTGGQPLRNVRITINLASDQQIPDNQFWNLIRVSDNTFDIAPMVLPPVGGSTSSIGYILSTPIGSSSGGSSLSIVNVSC